jgi:hypothetical protein
LNEQQKPQDQHDEPQGDKPLPTQPGHVMALEHYQRLAREAAEQQK